LARLDFGPQTRDVETSLSEGVAFVQDAGIAFERFADHPSQWNSGKDMSSLVSDCTTPNIGVSACEPDFEHISWRAFAIIFTSFSFIVDLGIDGVFVFVFKRVHAWIIDVIVVQGDAR
jgi:hypothetical protein